MIDKTKAVWDVHTRVLYDLEQIRDAADAVGAVPIEELRKALDRVYGFLTEQILPHARAEEPTIYAAARRVMGSDQAIEMMTRDHHEIALLTEELGLMRRHLVMHTPGELQAKSLRRVLYGLYEHLRLHIAKEEEILLPLLERSLSAEEAARLLADEGGTPST